MSEELIICDSPPMVNKQGYSLVPEGGKQFYQVEVSIDGGLETSKSDVKFSYYRVPQVTSVSPELGPVKGGTLVTVHGSGFVQPAVSKRVVRIGHLNVEPVSFTNTSMTFKAP